MDSQLGLVSEDMNNSNEIAHLGAYLFRQNCENALFLLNLEQSHYVNGAFTPCLILNVATSVPSFRAPYQAGILTRLSSPIRRVVSHGERVKPIQ